MSEYVTPETLLSDARLRLSALTSTAAVLVVEGWDDKRLFVQHTQRPDQVLVAGGKSLLLGTRDAADAVDLKRIVFFADCDYDVPRGTLHAGNGLVLTANADVECDLLSLGVLEQVVTELIPAVVRDDIAEEIAALILDRATPLAIDLGRIRIAAFAASESMRPQDLELRKFRALNTDRVDTPKLIRSAHGTADGGPVVSLQEFATICMEVPNSYSICNGHDLVRAVTDVIRRDFRMTAVNEDLVSRCLRLSLNRERFSTWSVAKRVRAWEDAMGVTVLAR
jgi:hypothetical protein